MKFTADERMMIMLYGNGTKHGLTGALIEMRSSLQPDEKELSHLTDTLLSKLNGMTEDEFKEATDGE